MFYLFLWVSQSLSLGLLVNHHPGKFLKRFSKFCRELETGVWEIDSNFCKVYLVELHKINLSGLDRFYLGNFSTDISFLELLTKTEAIQKGTKEAKWIDSIQKFIQDRITAFEKDPKIRRKFMATAYEADITELVKPYMDKAREEGELKGELKKAIETARKMREYGDSIEKIITITGLTESQLEENGIVF